jgi:hypothetical protein
MWNAKETETLQLQGRLLVLPNFNRMGDPGRTPSREAVQLADDLLDVGQLANDLPGLISWLCIMVYTSFHKLVVMFCLISRASHLELGLGPPVVDFGRREEVVQPDVSLQDLVSSSGHLDVVQQLAIRPPLSHEPVAPLVMATAASKSSSANTLNSSGNCIFIGGFLFRPGHGAGCR